MKLIGPFKQLLPMTGLPLRGSLADAEMPLFKDAGILVDAGKVWKVGPFRELYQQAQREGFGHLALEGVQVGMPGFIDAHTHLCFSGSRAADYALRNAGKSYLEIAKAGGGIWDTVGRSRAATQKELEDGIVQRAVRHLRHGITTIEVKSGYGLNVQEELKMLYAIREAGKRLQADLVPTCLAAHTMPKDFEGSPREYLELMSGELLPRLRKENLCRRVDAFIEESAFSKADIGPYFTAAKRLGFELTVHADQFTVGGSEAAIAYGALSADHLEASGVAEIKRLAASRVIATALPGASLGLGAAFAPARALLDAGAALAIASDWNPGSAPMGNLLTQAAILGAYEKLHNAEVFAGLTFRAAAALNLHDRGKLEQGMLADFVCFPTSDYREILYLQGSMKPLGVWKEGSCVYQEPKN